MSGCSACYCCYRIIDRFWTKEKLSQEGLAEVHLQRSRMMYRNILRYPSCANQAYSLAIVLEGVCDLDECPSESAILWSARNKLGMTWKNISQQPREARTPANIDKTDEYLEIVSRNDTRNLNFLKWKFSRFDHRKSIVWLRISDMSISSFITKIFDCRNGRQNSPRLTILFRRFEPISDEMSETKLACLELLNTRHFRWL